MALNVSAWLSLSGDITLGELLVGVGTLGLAFFTWRLAGKAGQDVDLTRQSIALSREGNEAQDRPFLVATLRRGNAPSVDLSPVYGDDSEEPTDVEWSVYPTVENIGRGPAIMYGAITLPERVSPDQGPAPTWQHEVGIRDGDKLNLSIWSPHDPSEDEPFVMYLYYRSASGARYVTEHRIKFLGAGQATRLNVVRRSL